MALPRWVTGPRSVAVWDKSLSFLRGTLLRHLTILCAMLSAGPRRSTLTVEQFAMATLAEKRGPVSALAGSEHRSSAVVEVDGREFNVSFKTTTYATIDRFEQMRRDDVGSGDGAVLVVADRVNAPAREAFEDMISVAGGSTHR